MDARSLARQLGPWSAGKGALHHKLAHALMETIRNGAISPGLRLPSERTLADALTVSRTTVVAAYDALRAAAWLESRPGSGTRVAARSPVVHAARGTAHATTLAASPLLGLLGHHDESTTVDLALGSPPPLSELPAALFTLPPDQHAALIKDRLYHPLGLAPLRQAIATELTHQGLDSKAENILVTNGAQHAIALCAALCLQRGDTALIEDPAYFGAIDAFRAAGARLTPLPVEANGVSPAAIRDRITATAARLIYLTPTYQNPTGATIPASHRKEIARIVTERGVPLIDDRTMADLALDGHPPPPIAAHAPDAPDAGILTIGSLSKLIWPGLRIGWIRATAPLIERLARIKSAMDLGSPLLTQAIAVQLIQHLPEARRLRKQQWRPRRDHLTAQLQKHLPHWRFQPPQGGFFLWVELPHGDSREFAQLALRHGVALVPGPTMSAAEGHTRHLRIPFFWDPPLLTEGVKRLSTAWREYRPAARRAAAVIV